MMPSEYEAMSREELLAACFGMEAVLSFKEEQLETTNRQCEYIMGLYYDMEEQLTKSQVAVFKLRDTLRETVWKLGEVERVGREMTADDTASEVCFDEASDVLTREKEPGNAVSQPNVVQSEDVHASQLTCNSSDDSLIDRMKTKDLEETFISNTLKEIQSIMDLRKQQNVKEISNSLEKSLCLDVSAGTSLGSNCDRGRPMTVIQREPPVGADDTVTRGHDEVLSENSYSDRSCHDDKTMYVGLNEDIKPSTLKFSSLEMRNNTLPKKSYEFFTIDVSNECESKTNRQTCNKETESLKNSKKQDAPCCERTCSPLDQTSPLQKSRTFDDHVKYNKIPLNNVSFKDENNPDIDVIHAESPKVTKSPCFNKSTYTVEEIKEGLDTTCQHFQQTKADGHQIQQSLKDTYDIPLTNSFNVQKNTCDMLKEGNKWDVEKQNIKGELLNVQNDTMVSYISSPKSSPRELNSALDVLFLQDDDAALDDSDPARPSTAFSARARRRKNVTDCRAIRASMTLNDSDSRSDVALSTTWPHSKQSYLKSENDDQDKYYKAKPPQPKPRPQSARFSRSKKTLIEDHGTLRPMTCHSSSPFEVNP